MSGVAEAAKAFGEVGNDHEPAETLASSATSDRLSIQARSESLASGVAEAAKAFGEVGNDHEPDETLASSAT